ncbi:PepSY domain-containing protein [Catenovulum sp. 2E275]|uniref:PepSY-associated TM helix domain-containing protein n=1 Tax=Catenovulum sp. 2E275 TaxID=2980497 RepID=UPI0021D20F9B|nr:PepSY-associated TM helix domain-containing protein [Catenovulum sp. 2E275]MCU4674365.1 PepSY domain-containing protein [Catenovulum sp. 2E275]
MVKLWLRRAHLLIALLAGILFIGLSITGALLIYAKDLQHYFQPDYWQVTENHQPALSLDVLTQQVQTKLNTQVYAVSFEPKPNLAWQFQLADKTYVSVNQFTGDILHRYQYYQTFYGYLLGYHRWLLYQNEQGEYVLRDWISIASLCLIIELLIGFYLWVRPKKRLKRLKINRKAKPKIFYNQLHTVVGVYILLPLILVAFSGMAFNWKNVTASIVEAVTFQSIEDRPDAPLVASNNLANLQLTLAHKNALSALPEAELFRIYLPKEQTQPIGFRMKMPGETHAYSWVWSDPLSGNVLQVYDASKANFATQVWNFRYKFHIGDFAGSLIQALWFVLALTPAFFVITGFYLFWARHKK